MAHKKSHIRAAMEALGCSRDQAVRVLEKAKGKTFTEDDLPAILGIEDPGEVTMITSKDDLKKLSGDS